MRSFFVFSVLFTGQTFRIDVSLLLLEMSKGGSTRYIWKFVNGPVMEMACRQPLSLAVRFKSFRALLFIEQHMRLFLKESLDTGTDGLENAEDWLDAEDAE